MGKERDVRRHRHLHNGQVASDADSERVSLMLNRRMAQLFPFTGKGSWYGLFNWMDDDSSGKISFAELEDMIRNELRVPRSELSDHQMKAIWCALDEDKSGLITGGEFGHFMRKGDRVHDRQGPSSTEILHQEQAVKGDIGRQEKRE